MNDRPMTRRSDGGGTAVADAAREGPSPAEVTARIAEAVGDVSADAGERLTEVATTASEAFRGVDSQLRRSSDQTLAVVGALSVGASIGLLVGGANRLLVVAALVPAALVAGIAADRMDRGSAHPGRT